MTDCLIGVGSNLGDRERLLDFAVTELSNHFNIRGQSRWFAYPSVGPVAGEVEQPDFLNGAVVVDSQLTVEETARVLHEIEKLAGRQRIVRWASRTLDIDLLLYGDQQIYTPELIVPHPRMVSRKFVLQPAANIAPQMVHPGIGWTMQRLYQHLVEKIPYFAVLGEDRQRAALITTRLAQACHGAQVLLLQDPPDSIDPQWLLRPSDSPATEQARELQDYLARLMAVLDRGQGPWLSNFWIGEFPCCQSRQLNASWTPKTLLLMDPPNSSFVRQLKESKPDIPFVFLSTDEQDAIQDAIGAVQGMGVDT